MANKTAPQDDSIKLDFRDKLWSVFGAEAPEQIQLTDEQTEKRGKVEKRLWYWNLTMGIMHLVWAIACLAVGLGSGTAGKFKIPQLTSYPNWSGGSMGPMAAQQTRGLVPFTALTSGFAWMSAFFHFLVLAMFPQYLKDLRMGINRFRWIEYAMSSTLMMVLISMLFGVWDVHCLFSLASCNACMNLFGYSFELQNLGRVGTKKIDWTNFVFGCFAGLPPWAVVISYATCTGGSGVPPFVWAILGVYIVLFQTFPINMWMQYAQVGAWFRDASHGFPGGGYYFGEKIYQILSLTAKSLLLWLVVGGTNQPNSYTQQR